MTPVESDLVSFLRVGELTWVDLVLPAETVDALRALAARAADGGLVACVVGPAGVGKTVSVRTLAEELRLDTWRVDCRLLIERHGERSARLVPELLRVAERPHAVSLWHEADWLFEPTAGRAGERLVELAAHRLTPTVLESRAPLAGAATALARVDIPFPGEDERAELWRRLAWRAHPLADLDVARLATVPVPGAAIEQALERVIDEAGGREPDTERLLAALAGSS